jgi:flagellar biosynthetic protein FlhF
LALPAACRSVGAHVALAVLACGALLLGGLSGSALGWLAGSGFLLAAALACAWRVRARLRRLKAGVSQKSQTPEVLACGALPSDQQLVPIKIGQGLLDTQGDRPEGRSSGPWRREPPEARRSSGPTDTVVSRPAGSVEQLPGIAAVQVEIGYALVPLASASRSGEWLGRIAALRRQVAAEFGMLVPPVKLKDNIRLAAHEYVIKVHGVRVGSGKLYPGQLLALADGTVAGKLKGRDAPDPAFGMPGVWIYPSQLRKAKRMNYTALDPCGVLMMHLAVLVRRHASDLLSREQVRKLLANLRADHPRLVREVAAKLKLSQIHKVLRDLLREGVSISDLKGVLEAVGDAAEKADGVDELTELTRDWLGPTIARQHAADDGRLWCVCLEPDLESTVEKYLTRTAAGSAIVIPRGLHVQITGAVSGGLSALRQQGHKPVVLCARKIRAAVRQLIAPAEPDAAVLAHNEVKASTVQTIGNVGIEATKPQTYRGPTVAAALAKVKRDLGRDAVILTTRKSGRSALLGLLGAAPSWEVTAVANVNHPDHSPKGKYLPADARRADSRECSRSGLEDSQKSPRRESSESLASTEHVARKMSEIHRMVETLVTRNGGPGDKFPPALRGFHEVLVRQDVAEEIAAKIVQQAHENLSSEQLNDREAVARSLRQQIVRRINTVGADAPSKSRPRVIVLVGPTGVGKTTTIAKLAANFKLRDGLRVGLVTMDTYRIAAVDQLRKYAEIIEVPLRVVLRPDDVRREIDSLSSAGVVLIDTAGRSQNDKNRLDELRSLLRGAGADEVHLVISATSNLAATKRTIENFYPLGANRIILTKLDEAETFGIALNVACSVEAPLSYVTTGQDVPDDIAPADAQQLAGRIMGGLVCVA